MATKTQQIVIKTIRSELTLLHNYKLILIKNINYEIKMNYISYKIITKDYKYQNYDTATNMQQTDKTVKYEVNHTENIASSIKNKFNK